MPKYHIKSKPGHLNMGFKKNQNALEKENQPQFKTKDQLEKEEQQRINKIYEGQIFTRLFGYSKDKVLLFIIGLIVAAINGVIYPLFTIFFGEVMELLFLLYDNPTQNERNRINLLCWVFVILGVGSLICNIFQSVIFSHIGERTT